jgi:hypothetical protein
MGSAIFRVTPAQGARRTARKLDRAARALRSTLIAELRDHVEPKVQTIFSMAAPYDFDERDDVHLADELDARIATAGQIRLTVNSPVRSPKGFAYTDVTRFGHRGPLIAKGPGPMRWKDAGGWHAAYMTAGHHPPSDWVEDAQPEAERVVADAADRLGRTIYTRLLT